MAIKKTKRASSVPAKSSAAKTDQAKSKQAKSSRAKPGPAKSGRAKSSVAKSGATKSSTTSGKKKVRKRKKVVKAVRSLVDETSSDSPYETGNTANETNVEGAAGLESAVGMEVSWAKKIRAYRTRQDSVARILDETMGVLAKCDPKLWGQRAYWMLVGLVYERLAVCEDEISTGELVSLAKVLAENRRVEVRSRSEKSDTHGDDKSSERMTELPTGELPEGLVDSVRQLYGVELENTNHKNGNAKK